MKQPSCHVEPAYSSFLVPDEEDREVRERGGKRKRRQNRSEETALQQTNRFLSFVRWSNCIWMGVILVFSADLALIYNHFFTCPQQIQHQSFCCWRFFKFYFIRLMFFLHGNAVRLCVRLMSLDCRFAASSCLLRRCLIKNCKYLPLCSFFLLTASRLKYLKPDSANASTTHCIKTHNLLEYPVNIDIAVFVIARRILQRTGRDTREMQQSVDIMLFCTLISHACDCFLQMQQRTTESLPFFSVTATTLPS